MAYFKTKGIKDTSKMNPTISLGELGIDSLMSIEVKQLLERDYDVTLTVQEIRQLSISQLREISEACSHNSPVPGTSGPAEEGQEPSTLKSYLQQHSESSKQDMDMT
ncbi:hypothetical protein HPB49_002673 [Dermacentor silvarum]|uniref:Uncharacterized protein n=1 Tax=Dermacentor silvarum TaxID=543639 RepID=A0ACB8CP84_DERSI|nr:hypothetical protein HPB49_002673 [Dermacentor silvarum]